MPDRASPRELTAVERVILSAEPRVDDAARLGGGPSETLPTSCGERTDGVITRRLSAAECALRKKEPSRRSSRSPFATARSYGEVRPAPARLLSCASI